MKVFIQWFPLLTGAGLTHYLGKSRFPLSIMIKWSGSNLVTGTGGAVTGTGGAVPALVAQLPALMAQYRHWWRSYRHWWRSTGSGGAVCKGATPSVEQ
jgi:hypothetical protein